MLAITKYYCAHVTHLCVAQVETFVWILLTFWREKNKKGTMHLTCRWGRLRLRRAAEPRGRRRGRSLCHRWLGNLPCCQKISRGCFSNAEMLGYGQCNDALRGHSSSTLQEDITIATSTCLSEKRITAHAQQVHTSSRFANITSATM